MSACETIWWQGHPPDLDRLNRSGAQSLNGYLGMEFVAFGDDWLTARMPVDARTHQPWGRLHGGASVALAETVGTSAAILTLDPEQFIAVGMEINANHVRPAHTGHVFATARPEARGRSTQVWSIRVCDEQGRLVCISRFTVAIIPRSRG